MTLASPASQPASQLGKPFRQGNKKNGESLGQLAQLANSLSQPASLVNSFDNKTERMAKKNTSQPRQPVSLVKPFDKSTKGMVKVFASQELNGNNQLIRKTVQSNNGNVINFEMHSPTVMVTGN